MLRSAGEYAVMQLPATLFAPPADNPADMSDAALVNARDYWRILF